MSDLFYKVIFEGDLLPGHNQSEVQKKLAILFKLSIEKTGKLFSGRQYAIKRNLGLRQAKKYVKGLAKIGVLGYIEQEPVKRTSPSDSKAVARQKEGGKDRSGQVKGKKKIEEKEESPYEILSLDEIDEEAYFLSYEEGERTDSHKVLDVEQIANIIKKSGR